MLLESTPGICGYVRFIGLGEVYSWARRKTFLVLRISWNIESQSRRGTTLILDERKVRIL